jgi:hypothetical protein
MKKGFQTYLVLFVILVQSSASLSATYQTNQSMMEKLPSSRIFSDSGKTNTGFTEQDLTNQNYVSPEPCENSFCCDCQCHFCTAILVSAPILTLSKSTTAIPEFGNLPVEQTLDAFLRPPIF